MALGPPFHSCPRWQFPDKGLVEPRDVMVQFGKSQTARPSAEALFLFLRFELLGECQRDAGQWES